MKTFVPQTESLGTVIDFKPEPSNMLPCKVVTFAGISIVSSAVQFWNELLASLVIAAGSLTDARDAQSAKMYVPKFVPVTPVAERSAAFKPEFWNA